MLDLVRDALSIVCGRDESAVSPESDLGGLGVDSLGRVALAEIVEDRLSAQLPGLHIPDDDLTRVLRRRREPPRPADGLPAATIEGPSR